MEHSDQSHPGKVLPLAFKIIVERNLNLAESWGCLHLPVPAGHWTLHPWVEKAGLGQQPGGTQASAPEGWVSPIPEHGPVPTQGQFASHQELLYNLGQSVLFSSNQLFMVLFC